MTGNLSRSPGDSVRSFVRFRARGMGLFSVALVVGSWAAPVQSRSPVLGGFDLSSDAGRSTRLPRALEEVSGLATSPDGRLFAHNDERAIVYQVDPETGGVVAAFSVGERGVPGDFEGLAMAEGRFFLVTSEGALVEFREGSSGSTVPYLVHATGLGRYCEMEGLAFDPRTRALLLPCKTSDRAELKDHLVVFSVLLDSLKPELVPRVFLPFRELEAMGLDDGFHPSAIEVHPVTRSLVIAAAREESLVELSPAGRLLAVGNLERRQHPQPEGLAFLPDGTLVIADEGQGERGRLTRYPWEDPDSGGSP